MRCLIIQDFYTSQEHHSFIPPTHQWVLHFYQILFHSMSYAPMLAPTTIVVIAHTIDKIEIL